MSDIKKIIFDTDLGGDCDDTGACAVLCNLAKRGEAQILCATYCIGNPWGGYFLRYELDWFGFSDIPVGVLKDNCFMTEPIYEKYSRPCVEHFGAKQEEAEDAVRVLRRTLAKNGGRNDIVLLAVGPLRNIANLLKSEADDISPMTGFELVRDNVCAFYTMLGNVTNVDQVEWNVLMDIPSAKYCIEHMPARIVFSPFEAGAHIITGKALEAVSEEHPVRMAYTVYMDYKCHERSSWDLITTYCAVREDNPLYRYEECHVTMTDAGNTIPCEGDDMVVIKQIVSDEEVVAAIDPLML